MDDRTALGIARREDDSANSRNADRASTHGTGFQRHIKLQPRQSVVSAGLRGLPDRLDFSMGRGIVPADGTIVSLSDKCSGHGIDYDGPDRNLAQRTRTARKIESDQHGVNRGLSGHDSISYTVVMRIVSGKFKGRPLKTPDGRGTRPTSDRARESLFNVLAHADWAPAMEGARVIDLFAGSGALGFEAISRGAAFCLFVETDHAARGAIRANVDTLQLFGITRIHRRSATDLGPKPAGVGEPFTLAFLDPPYNKGLVEPCLRNLFEGDWLSPEAIAVVETAADETPDLHGWDVLDTRDSGAAKLTIVKRS